MVSTLQTIQNVVWWVHNINMRLTLPIIYYGQWWVLYKLFRILQGEYTTLPVANYGQGWVLHRLFRILQGEYTTWILDLLYQLLIMDKGEYSTDYSESCKVSGLNTILKYSTSCLLWSRVSTLLTLRISSCCVLYIISIIDEVYSILL